mgnify:CR=1 FL=1|jgi:hypothetical protein
MATLCEKIKTLKSDVSDIDFVNNIIVQNDGGESYIAVWNHPTETQPTAEELKD